MFTLSYNIYESTGVISEESVDEVDDKFTTLFCNHWEDCTFGVKSYDMKFSRAIGSHVEYDRYEESADILDNDGNKVGHYTIKKV